MKTNHPDGKTSFQVLLLMTPFLIVRHPFVRLVSAYEDKILNPRTGLEYHRKVQKEIRKKRVKDEEHRIVFPEYLLLTDKYKGMLKRKVKQTINYKRRLSIISSSC